jgi:membrane protein
MAYALFFSLFPLLLFFAALLSLVGDQRTVEAWFNSRLAAALPADVARLLGMTIQKVVFAKGAPGILSFGLLTAVWSGSGVFGALRVALNEAYDVEETRPWWKQYTLQLAMLGVCGVVLLAATVILLNGEGVMSWLGDHLHLGPVTTLVWTVVQFPLAIGALMAVLWLIYYLLPNCSDQNKRILTFGAAIATTLWIAATLLFRVYVQKFNALNPAYGAVGAIMVLLTWMYYSAFVLLAVGELNSVLESRDFGDAASGPRRGRVADSVRRERVSRSWSAERRWAASVRSRGDGNERQPRGLRRFVVFRIIDRLQNAVAVAQDWTDETLLRLRTDVLAARREVATLVRSIGLSAMTLAIGGVLALLGALSLIGAVILLIGDQWLANDLYWLAALATAVASAALAIWLANRAAALVRRGLTPRETLETLRENRDVVVQTVAGRDEAGG